MLDSAAEQKHQPVGINPPHYHRDADLRLLGGTNSSRTAVPAASRALVLIFAPYMPMSMQCDEYRAFPTLMTASQETRMRGCFRRSCWHGLDMRVTCGNLRANQNNIMRIAGSECMAGELFGLARNRDVQFLTPPCSVTHEHVYTIRAPLFFTEACWSGGAGVISLQCLSHVGHVGRCVPSAH